MLLLPKYSLGIGDRFGLEGVAQLRALDRAAADKGIVIAPVWNKSHREHELTGTAPNQVYNEAVAAVRALRWKGPYFIDADHVGLENVGPFIQWSNFFTIDVADSIEKGKDKRQVDPRHLDRFVRDLSNLTGPVDLGEAGSIRLTRDSMRQVAADYLLAIEQAARIYNHIASRKGAEQFVTEVSMDETAAPQTPLELLVIVAGLHKLGVPLKTVAPKFSGKFPKGVDYVGDVDEFAAEFRQDVAAMAFAREQLGIDVKLSIHSGSDKFSLYPVMRQVIQDYDAGLHLKTAGTTWLEEVIGIAASGGEGGKFIKRLYAEAHRRRYELQRRYLAVLDISHADLPLPQDVEQMSGPDLAVMIRHDRKGRKVDRNVRQLMHIAYPIMAEEPWKKQFHELLCAYMTTIEQGVTENLYGKHIQPLFIGR